MTEEPSFGIPSGADVFKEIAKSEQHIEVETEKRRYGKVITIVKGFDKTVDIKSTAKSLKEELACGGTVKDGTIELQGDHRKRVRPALIKLGFPEESIGD